MGEKKVNGRKRHILTDTLGLLLAVWVHPADLPDGEAARRWLPSLRQRMPHLAHLWADRAYEGAVDAFARHQLRLAIVRRPTSQKGFILLPRRWVVERSFAWFGRARRLSKDFEHLPNASEAFVYLASIHLLLNRLTSS